MLISYKTNVNEFESEQFKEGSNGVPFKVLANGKDIPLHAARVSKMPFNRWWPGHQRPLDQTEIASFVSFETDESVEMVVEPKKDFNEVIIRPLSKKITPKVLDGKIYFTIQKPGQYTVELDGFHEALHLFVNPKKPYEIPDKNSPDVIYFGEGIHDAGVIELKSNQTLYIDENAVVYGRVYAIGKDNIKIIGRGILDQSKIVEDPSLMFDRSPYFNVHDEERPSALELNYCKNVYIEGITIRDSLFLTLRPICCENVVIDNVKIIGNWRYNSDGIDFVNSKDSIVKNSFVRSFDDSLCLKGFFFYNQGDMFYDGKTYDELKNVKFINCVVWNDWGHALETGVDMCAKSIHDSGFYDIDIIHGTGVMLDCASYDYAEIYNITYDNIRVEYDDIHLKPMVQTNDEDEYENTDANYLPTLLSSFVGYESCVSQGGKKRSHIHDITFKNISVTAKTMPPSEFFGFDNEHSVDNVTIENLYLNGEKITSDESFKIGEYVKNLIVK